MNNVTILITAAGTQSMPGLADCFHKNGEREVRIVATDMNDDKTILHMADAFYRVPRVTDPSYIESLLTICEKEKVDIFFPFMDEELDLVLGAIDKFSKLGTKVSISSKRAIQITNDKLDFYDFLSSNGIYVPEYYCAETIQEVVKACKKLGYPDKAVCVKTTNGSGSRGIRILKADESLYDIFVNEKPNTMVTTLEYFISILQQADTLEKMIVMEYLPGKEASVDLLAIDGKVKYMVGRVSSNVLASIPQDSVLEEIPEAYELCRKVVELLGYDGNADFDFKYNAEGKPILMELNPRLAATLSIIAMGGVNLPYLRVKQLLGEELPSIDVRYGVRMKRRYLDMFVDEDGKLLSWNN
ncbi:ATP-grasp domain-containing protein [Holdemania filiformis]|uniref:ATP-grasp domain-containing protein n=1 Tax=Holdemania filiformis TaxID=61171 RepID=UPI00242FB2F3|nr:ATP-grasp domain-containing protein [Holdemania filiformis]